MPSRPFTFFSSLVFFALLFQISVAQQAPAPESQTLNEQYNTLIEKSETFNDYKVIKRSTLNNFWEVVSDSVTQQYKSTREKLATIEAKNAIIEDLNKTIIKKNEELASGEKEKSNITVLGIEMNKFSYAIISIIIPIVLLLIIGFLVVKSRIDIHASKASKNNLIALEKEYDEHKKRALENQIKLNRELQTERNKIQELKK